MPNDGELYIRYSATDQGERDVPAGTITYLSPAIEVVGSGLGAGTVVAGIDQTVRVHVGNKGSNTRTDAMVQVYATDWGTVNPWLQSLGGSAGRTAGPFTVVGNAAVDTSSEGVIDVDWNPDPSELGGATELHVCLFANVYRPTDGAPQSDPPSFGDIATNQHHAQRNITLKASALGGSMGFGLKAANVGRRADVFTLEVTEIEGTKLAAHETRQLASAGWLASAQKQLGERLAVAKPARQLLLEAGGQRGQSVKLELEPGRQIPVVVHAQPADKTPGLHRFSIVQRSARTGLVVGGAVALVAVLPEKLIPRVLLTDAKRIARG